MHVTSTRVFSNNRRKKIAGNCVQQNKCAFRVELDESQCKCVCVSVSFPFLFVSSYLSLYYRIPFPKSGDFASGDMMIVSFRVWLSGGYDFRMNGITALLCGLK